MLTYVQVPPVLLVYHTGLLVGTIPAGTIPVGMVMAPSYWMIMMDTRNSNNK
jgi:hypothetical protein